MKKLFLFTTLALFLPSPSYAEDFTKDISGTIGSVSQYSFRGLTQSDEHPAIQGSIDYAHDSGLYAGIWGSTVDFNDGDEASIEADVYGGWSGEYNDVSLDAGLIYYAYPGAENSLNYDFGAKVFKS